jgi:hypothetical protein
MRVFPGAGTPAGGIVNAIFTIFVPPAQALLPANTWSFPRERPPEPGNAAFAIAGKLALPRGIEPRFQP